MVYRKLTGAIAPKLSAAEYQRDAKTELAKRFWAHVSGSGDDCWPWVGVRSLRGYGQLKFAGKWAYSDRTAWLLAFGYPVPKGKFLTHTCKQRICCNPSHLKIGTSRERGERARRDYGAEL